MRNPTRSMIIIIAVFIGVFGGVFSVAVMNGAAQRRIADLIDLETAHIRVCVQEFDNNNELQYFIPDSKTILEKISATPGVEAACSRLNMQAMASSALSNSGVVIYGIDPKEYAQVFRYGEHIADSNGTFFGSGYKNEIVVGDKLAKKLNIKLYSTLELSVYNTSGNFISKEYTVCGIFHTSNTILNEYRVFVRNSDIASALMLPANAAHEIFVRIHKNYDFIDVKNMLQGDMPHLKVQTWQEANPTVGMIDTMMQSFMYLFMLIILLTIALGILNTMFMVVMERVRELGMLKAVGMSRGKIFLMIVSETVLTAFAGGLPGMLVSGLLLMWLGKRGLNLDMMGKGLEAAGFSSFIYPYVEFSFFFGVSFLVIGVAVFASILPALRAIRLTPAEALKVNH